MFVNALSHYVNPHSVWMPQILCLSATWIDLNLYHRPMFFVCLLFSPPPSSGCLLQESVAETDSALFLLLCLYGKITLHSRTGQDFRWRAENKCSSSRPWVVRKVIFLLSIRLSSESCYAASASYLALPSSYLYCPLPAFHHLLHLSLTDGSKQANWQTDLKKNSAAPFCLWIKHLSCLSAISSSPSQPLCFVCPPTDSEMNHGCEGGPSVMIDEEGRACERREWTDSLTSSSKV